MRRSRALIAQERRVLGGLLELSYGHYAAGLLLQGDLEAAREALAELFQQCRLTEGERFPFFMHLCAELAISERRFEAAARLIGYANAERVRRGAMRVMHQGQPAYVPIRAKLAEALGTPTLQRLMAEGATLDQEAMFALTLERAEGDRAASDRRPVG